MENPLKTPAAEVIRRLKDETAPATRIPVFQFGRNQGWLEPVTWADLDLAETLTLLTSWRQTAAGSNPPSGSPTLGGMRQWLGADVLESPDRILFWVKGLDGTAVGHVGLSHLDPDGARAEINYLLRGVPRLFPGLMYGGVQSLLVWTFQTLAVETLGVRLAAANAPALRLFQRCSFEVVGNGPAAADGLLTLALTRKEWMAPHLLERAA
jgi:RimJ/RimL family protein N-acetyltransferase